MTFLELKCFHHFERIRGRHHDLAHQFVWVKGDRRNQIVQLIGSQRLIGCGECRGALLRP